MATPELEIDLKRALALAREALDQDAMEARRRGRGVSSPDAASIAHLAAGIVVAESLPLLGREQEQFETFRDASAGKAGASDGAGATRPRKAKGNHALGKRRRGRLVRQRRRG